MEKNKVVRKKTKVLKVAVIISLFVFLFIVGFIVKYIDKDIIYGNVKINNIDVSGLEKDEAIDLLKGEVRNDILNTSVELYYNDFKKSFFLKEIDADYNYDEIVEEAFKKGKDGNLISIMFNQFTMRNDKYTYDMEIRFDDDKLREFCKNTSEDIHRPQKDAQLEFDKGKFKIIEETIGLEADEDMLLSHVGQSIKKEEFQILIPVKEIVPKVTREVLSKINGELATYVTYFSSSNTNRVKNIQIATGSINGTILFGGEELSFNDTTGKRSHENGYLPADVIVNGKLVPGYGGGVCQVSTTLYNAALLSNIDIVERHNHSIPSSYVDIGQDATVSYGYLDLKIKNTYNDPIYIQGITYNDRVIFKLYGNANKFDLNIKIQSEVIEAVGYTTKTEIDNSLAPGEKQIIQKGRKGYKVKTYKVIYKDNKVIDRILLSSDYYKPSTQIEKVGPKKSKTEESKTED
ncbi:VanW family protein [Clostridium sp. D2Q-11]|uniref:VanW family protein n=1 Tax=Anaeromonas frigoriresistens TaxID=2683708 RepID=A0A942UWQ7_9FIRM|nr:VanW family protein [Anaeromonas frigoriresistens]MBS4537796.1 VanW family protein [Anaeromonas frigoriresistens]